MFAFIELSLSEVGTIGWGVGRGGAYEPFVIGFGSIKDGFGSITDGCEVDAYELWLIVSAEISSLRLPDMVKESLAFLSGHFCNVS